MLKSFVPLTSVALLAACAATPRPSETAAKAPSSRCAPSANRIPSNDPRCVHGASYTQEDLQRSGTTDTGQALQMLDPTITVHGH